MSSSTRTMLGRALALAAAVGVCGVSFGALASGAGIDPRLACAMSVLVFAGGAQFATLGVLAGGGSWIAAVASGLLLNTRYVAMGFALSDRLTASPSRRALLSHLLIDESAAVALSEPDAREGARGFWITGLAIFIFWNAGTLLGATAGATLGDPRALGIDAAFPATMLALLGGQLRTGGGRATAIAGALLALVLAPAVPPGIPVLASTAGVAAGVLWDRRFRS